MNGKKKIIVVYADQNRKKNYFDFFNGKTEKRKTQNFWIISLILFGVKLYTNKRESDIYKINLL